LLLLLRIVEKKGIFMKKERRKETANTLNGVERSEMKAWVPGSGNE